MDTPDPYARPHAVPRAMIAVGLAWVGILAQTTLLATAYTLASAGGRTTRLDHAPVILLYPLVVLAILVLLPVGARQVWHGRSDGRVFVTIASAVSLPLLFGCAGLMGLTALEARAGDAPDRLTLLSGLPALIAGIALLTAILYLWQPAVTAYFRSALTEARMPHPKAPGQW